MHVDQVMAGVAPDDRCTGHEDEPSEGGGLLSKLFGR